MAAHNKSADEEDCEEDDDEVEQHDAPQLLSGVTLRPYQLAGFNWLRVSGLIFIA